MRARAQAAPPSAPSARLALKQAFTRRIDGFRYGGWMTFVTSAWFCLCSGLELLVSGETQRRGTWRVRAGPIPRLLAPRWLTRPLSLAAAAQDYCTLAALTTSGMYLTNWYGG